MSINLSKYILRRRRPSRPRRRSSAGPASLVQIHPESPFARLVRRRRCAQGYSMFEAANMMDYELMKWCRMEVGLWVPDEFYDLWRLAAILNCSFGEISTAAIESGGLR